MKLFLETLVHGNASQIIFNGFSLSLLEEENDLKFVLAGFLNLSITAAMLTSAIDLMSFFCSRAVSTSEGMLH